MPIRPQRTARRDIPRPPGASSEPGEVASPGARRPREGSRPK